MQTKTRFIPSVFKNRKAHKEEIDAEFDEIMRETRRREGVPSDCKINGPLLAEKLQKTIEEFSNDGFSVKQIIPIVSGGHDYTTVYHLGEGGGAGWGFSYTEGLIVVGEKD